MNRILTCALAASLMSAPLTAAPSLAAPATSGLNAPNKITRCKRVYQDNGWCDLVTLASAAEPGPASDMKDRSELAMKCWLGIVGNDGCWKSKCGLDDAGALERVEYLGRTAAGVDIYQVRYRHRSPFAYGIVPDPKGSGDQYLVKATDLYRTIKEISPRPAPVLIYARPQNAPDDECAVRFSAPFGTPYNEGEHSGPRGDGYFYDSGHDFNSNH